MTRHTKSTKQSACRAFQYQMMICIVPWKKLLKKVCPTSQKSSLKKAITEELQVSSHDQQPIDKKTEASLKALDMLEKGLLTEKAVLAVIGTHEESYYSLRRDVRIKALELVEQDKLSERGLIAILGV